MGPKATLPPPLLFSAVFTVGAVKHISVVPSWVGSCQLTTPVHSSLESLRMLLKSRSAGIDDTLHIGVRGMTAKCEGPALPGWPKKQGPLCLLPPPPEPGLGSTSLCCWGRERPCLLENSDSGGSFRHGCIHSTARRFFVVHKENVMIMIFFKKIIIKKKQRTDTKYKKKVFSSWVEWSKQKWVLLLLFNSGVGFFKKKTSVHFALVKGLSFVFLLYLIFTIQSPLHLYLIFSPQRKLKAAYIVLFCSTLSSQPWRVH